MPPISATNHKRWDGRFSACNAIEGMVWRISTKSRGYDKRGGKTMKKTTLLLMAIFVLVGAGLAAWDYMPPPKPAQDIADALAQLPRQVATDYGTSDRTLVMFNIAALRDVVMKQGERIKVLEGEVAILARLKLQELRGIADPNEVAK